MCTAIPARFLSLTPFSRAFASVSQNSVGKIRLLVEVESDALLAGVPARRAHRRAALGEDGKLELDVGVGHAGAIGLLVGLFAGLLNSLLPDLLVCVVVCVDRVAAREG
eukprot:6200760-Pleurochrysis_carterae.AAC.1